VDDQAETARDEQKIDFHEANPELKAEERLEPSRPTTR
jgi:hypothetical protein